MKRFLRLVVWVLMCGHFSAWGGGNEDLLAAAKAGKSEEIERLLNAHADVSAQDAEGNTPLYWAAGAGNRKAVELLIAHHANVNARTRSGYTPLHMAAYWKRKEIAQLLLEHGAEINARTPGGFTPLFKAVEPLDAISATEGGGILPTLAPAEALANKELVALLLAKGAQANVKHKNSNDTPLHFAATLGVPDIVELLIASGAEVDAKGTDGVTPLYLAARYDRKEVAETLLAHGANIETPSIDGESILDVAASNGNSAMVELLLRHGANANIKDEQGVPLLLRPLRIEMKIYSMNSPLSANRFTPAEKAEFDKARKAVKGEWQAVVRLLILHGADVNASHGGDTPLYIAATMGDRDLVDLLLGKGAHVSGDISPNAIETPLHSAIAENHKEVAELLIKHGANVNALNMSKRTPLHFLARDVKDKKLAELMIAKGADVAAQDKNGETPYDFAIGSGNREIAEILQKHGAKASGKSPATPSSSELKKALDSGIPASSLLGLAAQLGNLEMVELLLEKGAEVNTTKGEGGILPILAVFSAPYTNSAMVRVAARRGEVKMSKEQLEKLQKMQGQWREIALLLILKGANVNTQVPNTGLTPLHFAAAVNYNDVAELLLVKGASINAKAELSMGMTPLHLALANGHIAMVKLLIVKGADIHARGPAGYTFLHWATLQEDENGNLRGFSEIVELLIARGADANAKADNGMTPLHLAAITGETEMAKLLIAKGAEVNAKDAQSHTPLFIARMKGNSGVAKFLTEQGGWY